MSSEDDAVQALVEAGSLSENVSGPNAYGALDLGTDALYTNIMAQQLGAHHPESTRELVLRSGSGGNNGEMPDMSCLGEQDYPKSSGVRHKT